MNLAIVGLDNSNAEVVRNNLYDAIEGIDIFSFSSIAEIKAAMEKRKTIEYHKIWIFQSAFENADDATTYGFEDLLLDNHPSTRVFCFLTDKDWALVTAASFPKETSLHYLIKGSLDMGVLYKFAKGDIAALANEFSANLVSKDTSTPTVEVAIDEPKQSEEDELPDGYMPKKSKKGRFKGLFSKHKGKPTLVENQGPINQGSVVPAYVNEPAIDESQLSYDFIGNDFDVADSTDAIEDSNESEGTPEVDVVVPTLTDSEESTEDTITDVDTSDVDDFFSSLEDSEVIDDVSEESKASSSSEAEDVNYVAYHDPLTDCLNRTSFDKDFEKSSDTLILFDVNNLKYTNDVYGHASGDRLLTTIADILKGKYDKVYRIGGDEFAVLTDFFDPDTLAAIDKELKQVTLDRGEFEYAVAYGFADASEGDSTKVYSLADERMYADKKEKKQGRASMTEALEDYGSKVFDDSLDNLASEIENVDILQVDTADEIDDAVEEIEVPDSIEDVSFDFSGISINTSGEVVVKKVIHSSHLINRFGKQVILVTGNANTGSTRFALNLASCVPNSLYVDLDTDKHGSIFTVGLDYHLALTDAIRHGLKLYANNPSIGLEGIVDFYDNGNFAMLGSSFDDDVTEKDVANVVMNLMTQDTFETIIIDCPLTMLNAIEVSLKDMYTIIVTDGYMGKFYNLFQELYGSLNETLVALLLRNAGFVCSGRLSAVEFEEGMQEFIDIFELDVPFLNVIPFLGFTEKVKGVYKGLLERL